MSLKPGGGGYPWANPSSAGKASKPPTIASASGTTSGKPSLWERAKERYLLELGQQGDFDSVLETASWDMILVQTMAKSQGPTSLRNSAFLTVQRLEPSLMHMNNFVTVLAVLFGADPKMAALIWGSIRIILSLALPVAETLQNILNMLEELSMSLPKFKAYEESLPMNDGLEKALLDVYVEIICFCARTIRFFRSNPHQLMLSKAWPTLDNDFKKTIKWLQHLSHIVEEEAEAAKMRLNAERNAEILSLMQSLKTGPTSEATRSEALPCFHVPFTLNQRSIQRNDIIGQIASILDPEPHVDNSALQTGITPLARTYRPGTLKSLAVYGTGGVGKTQIALQYSHLSRDKFDAILWISSDDNVKMAQDFLAVAQHLKLMPDGKVHDSVTAMSTLKSWLADTTCKWLLVFDNADNLEVLKYGWPGGCSGSILVTTRDSSAGFSPATQALQVHPFNEVDGATAFLSLIREDPNNPQNQALAREISQELGGLPLALSQMSGYIIQQKLVLQKFLPLYKRNRAKIHNRKAGISDYEHTLGTVWQMSLSSLTGHAASLQKLLAFLDPDMAHELVLITGMEKIVERKETEDLDEDEEDEHELGFLTDEMDFNDAKEVLLRTALVDRSADTESLSVHRLVQVAVINELSKAERTKYFNYAIEILSEAFPSSWVKATSGYVFEAWEMCEKCLRHVNIVAARWKEYKLTPSNQEKFTELLDRAAWYLYEAERYSEAKKLLDVAIEITDDKSSLSYARSINLYANCCVDTNLVHTAYDLYSKALRIRETTYGVEHPRVAVSHSNLGMCCTGLDQTKFSEGLQHLEKSLEIRMKVDPAMIGNTYSNMASLLLRMGKPDEAEKALASCPSLKDMSDETFLKLDNPRFSSDMFLLSRIRAHQGRREDALRLGSKALEFRRTRWGNGFKTCASLLHVAELLHADGNSASALKLLEECTTVGASLPEAEGYVALAHFVAGTIGKAMGSDREGRDHLEKGAAIKNKLIHEGGRFAYLKDWGNDDRRSYEQLVAWMVW